MSIKEKIKKTRYEGIVRWLYELRFLPELINLRWKVKKRVGIKVYKIAKNKKFASIPNKLTYTNIHAGGYALEKILLASGVAPEQFNPHESFDVILQWQDITDHLLDVNDYIFRSYDYTKRQFNTSINFACLDISKKKIASIHKKALGHELDVNPLEYYGLVVKKSDKNAAHDGVIIDCPIKELENDSVYNILINNEENGQAIDYRVIYINGVVDIFYEKRRCLSDRFSNTNDVTIIRETKDEFTKEEIEKIELFASLLGADYGEFDVLRDQNTKKLYIVDFAKTPAGPPNGLSKKDRLRAIEEMSVAFINNILISAGQSHD